MPTFEAFRAQADAARLKGFAPIQAQLDSNPILKEMLTYLRSQNMPSMAKAAYIENVLKAQGITVPDGWVVDPESGQLAPEQTLVDQIPMVLGGGALMAGGMAGLGALAGGAGAGTAAGAGTTTASTAPAVTAATGGELAAGMKALGDIGTVVSKGAQGAAQGNVNTAELQQRADQIALQRYLAGLSSQNVDLQQRNFALDAPSTRAHQSVQGDIMANAQDVNISGLPSYVKMGQISGGLRPSLMSGNTRQLGGEMSRKALMDQMKGDSFAPLDAPPAAGSLPSSALPNAMGAGGLGLQLGPMIAGLSSRSAPPTTNMPTIPNVPLGPVGQQSDPLSEYYAWLDQQQQGDQGGF